jgi:8-oxo-dGTP diphosphatase
MKKIQQVSIKDFLCRNKKVLFLKTPKAGKKNGIWELPGGRMDFGENVEQAFRREMREEIGFQKVKMGGLINTWSFTSIREGVNHHFMMFDFEIFTDESKIELSFEHTEYKWVREDDFENMDMKEGHKETLRRYFKNI